MRLTEYDLEWWLSKINQNHTGDVYKYKKIGFRKMVNLKSGFE